MGQRNAEWCGHGPVLEQDIAITNISLDQIGQARNLYQYAASLYNELDHDGKKAVDALIPQAWKTYRRELNEDDLAFLREERQYLNLLLCELPKGDWAQTVLKQFFFSAFQHEQYTALLQHRDPQLAAIAEKSLKEVVYHLRWSSEWVIRLGDGTDESNGRVNQALDLLWPYAGELFLPASFEKNTAGVPVVDLERVKQNWLKKTEEVFHEATLAVPPQGWAQQGGKDGRHTEHMGFLLADMQYLQRAYPNASW
jgi:ring-1,2-phenylacetyl-CoA epoxidase subunit PaaC